MSEHLTIQRPAMSAGMEWVRLGWSLFKKWPIAWMGMTAAALIVLIFLGSLPHIGFVILILLLPVMTAGYMAASRAAMSGEPVTFVYLAVGFREGTAALLTLGGILLGAMLLDAILVQAILSVDMSEFVNLAEKIQQQQMTEKEIEALIRDKAMPALMLFVLLLSPVLVAISFAPALIVFNGFKAGKALWWSFWACLVNWRPVLIFSLVMGAIAQLANLVPFQLGLLLSFPWSMAATFSAYQAIFVGETRS